MTLVSFQRTGGALCLKINSSSGATVTARASHGFQSRGEEDGARHPRASRLRLLSRGALHARAQAAPGGAANDVQAAPSAQPASVVLQPATVRRFPVAQVSIL
jgi:hypothetical protein